MIDKFFSNSVVWLRLLMCSFVVFIHTPFIDTPAQWPQTLHTTIRMIFTCLSVPFFFFTSGYFYFAKLENNFSWNFYKKQTLKRINSLLLPYILWCSFTLCSVLVTAYIRYNIGEISFEEFNKYITTHYILHSFWDLEQGVPNINILGAINSFSYPLLIPLWFLRDLIIISILSPIIWYAINIFGKLFLVIITIFYLCLFWQTTGFSAQCLFFYILGAYITLNKIKISTLCNRYRWSTLLISILIISITIIYPSNNTYIYSLERSLLSIISLMAIIGWSTNIQLNNSYIISLSSSAFFIYCFHGMPIYKMSIINFTHKIATQISYPPSLYNIMPCLIYIIEGISNILICYIIYYIIKLYFPKICLLLCGNR